jgi:probable rRNA maturation factor
MSSPFPCRRASSTDITPDLLGDVVISADTAHREAVEAGMPMAVRFNQLLIHGILHLVGSIMSIQEKRRQRWNRKAMN